MVAWTATTCCMPPAPICCTSCSATMKPRTPTDPPCSWSAMNPSESSSLNACPRSAPRPLYLAGATLPLVRSLWGGPPGIGLGPVSGPGESRSRAGDRASTRRRDFRRKWLRLIGGEDDTNGVVRRNRERPHEYRSRDSYAATAHTCGASGDAADPRRQGAGGWRCADQCAVDDDHANR